MICPHCKKSVEFVIVSVRAASSRKEYFRQRYLKSGKAVVRTSIEQYGKCIDCGEPTEGQRWYCDHCHVARRTESYRLSKMHKRNKIKKGKVAA